MDSNKSQMVIAVLEQILLETIDINLCRQRGSHLAIRIREHEIF